MQKSARNFSNSALLRAALSGTPGREPSSSDADAPLQRMVEAIKGGAHGAYIPFDRQGQPVSFG